MTNYVITTGLDSATSDFFTYTPALIDFTYETSRYCEDEEEVFDELVANENFLFEAAEARKQIRGNASNFVNFTNKYSKLIEK